MSFVDGMPRWARVSAVVLGIVIGSEVAYEVYEGWRSWCARRAVRRQAARHLTEVYFANERSAPANAPGVTMASFTTEHVRRIVALIDRARCSICLCMYIVTIDSVGDALLRAAKRGVRVRVVGCFSMAYSSGSQMTKLADGGVPVRFNRKDGAYLMHHKFCLIDTDWLCPRCYHEEKVRRNGFCCGATLNGVGAGVGAGASSKVSSPSVSVNSEGQNGGSANGPSVASGGGPSPTNKVRCVDDGSRCVRCDPAKRRAVEKCKTAMMATEPLPIGGLVVTGSTNWTMQALSGNWDNMIATSMPEIVQPFQMEFQRLWRDFALLPPVITPASSSNSPAKISTAAAGGDGAK